MYDGDAAETGSAFITLFKSKMNCISETLMGKNILITVDLFYRSSIPFLCVVFLIIKFKPPLSGCKQKQRKTLNNKR